MRRARPVCVSQLRFAIMMTSWNGNIFRVTGPLCGNSPVTGEWLPAHRPYSRQGTEWMECDVAIHPPPSVYPKAGNGALRGQWAMKYHCKNNSPTIVFTVRDLFHWNYVTSENIPRVCKSWKSLLIYVLATYIFCSSDTHSTAINFR